jgi:hypothetical protein
MKRKIALLLAFTMMFSLLPMTVSAARLSGGALPTIPVDEGNGVLVSTPNIHSNWSAAGVEWAGDLYERPAARTLSIAADQFPVGTYRGIVTLDGLNSDDKDGVLISAVSPFGGPQLISQQVPQKYRSGSTIPGAFVADAVERSTTIAALVGGVTPVERPQGAGAMDTVLPNEILAYNFGETTAGDVRVEVVLVRDGSRRDRAIMYVHVEADDTMIPAGVGTQVPINFLTYSDGNIAANINWPQGLSGLPTSVPIASRASDDFTIRLSDDAPVFNTRTQIPAIEFVEPSSLGFNRDGPWAIRLTLERGFQWDRRHDGGTKIFLGTELESGLGLTLATTEVDSELDDLNRERNRALWIPRFDFTGLPNQGRFSDTLKVGDGDDGDGYLWITAGDNARYGDVRVFAELVNSGGDVVSDAWITVATYSDSRIVFRLDDDEDLQDYIRPSGRQEWDPLPGASNSAGAAVPWDAIDGSSVVEEYHETAWTVLTETVRGTLPFTGLRDITFEFPQGAQVLGVRWETNDGNFIDAQNDESGEAWHWDGRTRGNVDGDDPMDILITRNLVRIRPEIGADEGRDTIAALKMQFYVSIQPEFEALFGDELWVNAYGPGFEDGLGVQVAIVRDPITVETNRVNVGDGDIVAAGMFRHIVIDPVTVHETEPGALEWDLIVALFVEENTFFDTIPANAIIIRSFTVETDGESGLEVSRPINNGRGTFVNITRTSAGQPGWIRFSNIEITGLVLPGHDYSITVVGSAVAQNYPNFAGNWGGITNQRHGWWYDEPYKAPAFGFDGTDALAPDSGPSSSQNNNQQTVTPPQSVPRMINQAAPFTTSRGETIFPALVLQRNSTNPDNATSFLAAAVVRDILGWEDEWNEATRTGTFRMPDGRSLSFTAGQTSAMLDGVAMPMVDTEGAPVPAQIIGDRFVVPIRFFSNLGVNVTWIGGTEGNNTLTVTP